MLQPRVIILKQPQTLLILTILGFLWLKCEGGLVLQLKSQKLTSAELPEVEAFEIKRENVKFVRYPGDLRGQRSTSLQIVNVTRNSDLYFGEVTAQDSALLLQCEAPYSVQWIYRGDGDPEFNTNTTTRMDYSSSSRGSQMYSAYLFLGSRRNLNERETGKYICTSVRNKRLFSFLYIYVANSALFTSKGLETVHYSPNDESLRIPCSLSQPKAATTLQKKSHDGVLQCPMNDSVRYDPKHGFVLNLSRLHQPQGSYLCIADFNNTFQIIKFNVVREDGHNGTGSEQNSEEFESPDHHEPSEFEPGHFTTPGPISSPSTSHPPGNCLKTKLTCGLNAICHYSSSGPERCRCIEGFGGNPYVECRPKSEIPTTQQPPPTNDNDLSCSSYDDCPFDLSCYESKCQDPCKDRPICGPHTTCITQHHTPFCECEEGYEGDPYSSQEGQRCQRTHCSPNPCGPNTICKYVNGIISCSCESGFSTHNDGVCRPNHKEDLNLTPNATTTTTSTTTSTTTTAKPAQIIQIQGQPKNPLPKPSRNRTSVPIRTTTSTTSTARPGPAPTTKLPQRQTINQVVISVAPSSSTGKECHYDVDCPDDKMCVQDKCENPCVNACGSGAKCTTRNHFPRCVCPEGTTGDPFYKCSHLFSGVLGSQTAPSDLESVGNTGRYNVNCGGRYSPCGPNSVCQASRNRFVCACTNNYKGDPYSSRGCYSETGYQKCHKDDDCPHFLTCLRYRGCVNPCDVQNVCANGRSCVPHMHKPACLKTANFDTEVPRDGIIQDEAMDELEISEIPKEMIGSSCFIMTGRTIYSPCGRNAICYDNDKKGHEPFCGCMVNHVGDPFIGCDPLQACKRSKECGVNEACLGGFCRLGFGIKSPNNDTSGEESKIRIRNPCSPTPCKNAEDRCAINRETNSPVCISPGRRLEEAVLRKPVRYLSRSGLCALTGECGEDINYDDDMVENDDENISTTELASEDLDFTVISTSTTGALPSSVGPFLSSSSIEDNQSFQNRILGFSLTFSKETTPVSHESTVVDV